MENRHSSLNIVLVIGNFEGEFKSVWKTLANYNLSDDKNNAVQQLVNNDENFNCWWSKFIEKREGTNEDGQNLHNDDLLLYPLSDMDYAEGAEFQKQLFKTFQKYNVIAIISFSSAKNNDTLVRQLKHINIPIFVILATSLKVENAKNVIRLIPGNEIQAEVLTAAVHIITHEYNRFNAIKIFHYPQNDVYVNDLFNRIHSSIKNENYSIGISESYNIQNLLPINPNEIFMFISYPEFLKRIKDHLNIFDKAFNNISLLFLTDSCFVHILHTELKKITSDFDFKNVWISYPAYPADIYAIDAYKAINDYWAYYKACSLNISISNFIDYIIFSMQNNHLIFNHRYMFKGNDNIKGGFNIGRLDRISLLHNNVKINHE